MSATGQEIGKALEYFGEISAETKRASITVDASVVVNHARVLVNEIARLERALIAKGRAA